MQVDDIKGKTPAKSHETNNGCLVGFILALFLMTLVGFLFVKDEEMKGFGIIILLCSAACILILLVSRINNLISNSSRAQSKRKNEFIKSQLNTAKVAYNKESSHIKKEILQNFINHHELSNQANELKIIINSLKNKTSRKSSPKLENQLELHESKLSTVIAELNDVQMDIDKNLTDSEKEQYSDFCDSFEEILDSEKKWIITSSARNTGLKSPAAYSIRREEINFDVGVFNFIKSSRDIPVLRDLQGYSYYVYPRYIIKALSYANFEVFPINTIGINYSKVHFIEENEVPIDTQIIEYRYKYENKNGGRDRRYTYNPKLPLVEYGKIQIEMFGLTYHVSNVQSAEKFVNAYNLLRNESETTMSSQEQQQIGISEEYFNQVNEVTEKLVSFYHELKHDNDLLTLFKRHSTQKDGTLEDADLVYILFCIDIKTCYDNLQIPVDFSMKENLGFNIFSKRALGLSEVKYFQLETFMTVTANSHDSMLNMIESTNLQGEATHIFLIADLLHATDKQKMQQYMILMYRFASIIAKADGTISDTEQQWLTELLKVSELHDDFQTMEEYGENDSSSEFANLELDVLFEEAARLIVVHQQGSTSLIQRKFSIGYNRADRLMEQLEATGIVGSSRGSKPREIFINDEDELEAVLKRVKAQQARKVKQKRESIDRVYPSLKTNSQEELNTLIGLTTVKEEIKTLTNFIKIQQQREAKGLKTSQLSYHCVFTGNPGTGKTTVARIIAGIYKELGVLKKGHLVETDRSGLVAEYVGQTAVKTNEIIDSALGGVLFIDEAYSLASSGDNDYGKEAIATLLKRMEDDRDQLVVILAGYTDEMKEFIHSNSGLRSRFSRHIEFPDYSAEELYRIFELKAKRFDYTISEDAENRLKNHFNAIVDKKDKNFGNARFVRNFFEKTLEQQANRLALESNLTIQKLTEIKSDDVNVDL